MGKTDPMATDTWHKQTLTELVGAHLATAAGLGDLGIQRSDFVRHIGVRLLRSRWPIDEKPPETATTLTRATHATAVALMADAAYDRGLHTGARRCREASAILAELIAARGLAVGPRFFSEKIAVWIGGRLAAGQPSGA